MRKMESQIQQEIQQAFDFAEAFFLMLEAITGQYKIHLIFMIRLH